MLSYYSIYMYGIAVITCGQTARLLALSSTAITDSVQVRFPTTYITRFAGRLLEHVGSSPVFRFIFRLNPIGPFLCVNCQIVFIKALCKTFKCPSITLPFRISPNYLEVHMSSFILSPELR